MTFHRATDASTFEAHGATFRSLVSPTRGSEQLCAWRLDLPARSRGVTHRPSHEEVLLVLEGRLTASVDDVESELATGDVVVVPAGGQFRIDTDGTGAAAWVTTNRGLTATMPDGTTMAPPWAN